MVMNQLNRLLQVEERLAGEGAAETVEGDAEEQQQAYERTGDIPGREIERDGGVERGLRDGRIYQAKRRPHSPSPERLCVVSHNPVLKPNQMQTH
jgi:hypothetical protein